MKKIILISTLLVSIFANEKLYIAECGSCHMSYQSELLPPKSWSLVMGDLENHFGVDASLDEDDRAKIETFLVKDSGDKLPNLRGHLRKFIRSITDENTIRITKIPYFIKEHRKLPTKLITQEEVKSLSFCNKCHTDAEKGSYRERAINIPNYGRYDD